MDLQRWKELETVIKCGSLTAAAEELGYTLSGISRSMKTLEEAEGIQLLHRGKKGIRPTRECEDILPYVQELLRASERLSQKTASVRGGEEGLIQIGTAYRHYYKWLTKVTSKFHELHPGVTFRIYTGTSTEFVTELEQHQIDFCLISEREGEHGWIPFCKDPLVALLPEGHKLAKRKTFSAKAAETEAYIVTCPGLDIDGTRYLDKHGIKPNVQFSTMDIQATYAMAAAGMGVSITNQINSLPDYEGVCHRKLVPAESIEIGLAWEKNQSPAAAKFLEFIRMEGMLPSDIEEGTQ